MNARAAKVFTDPVHGFISVPRPVILDLVESPEVQRLRRIRQLGVGHFVFAGAEHSRFGHALGAMSLMWDTLSTLAEKGTTISTTEHAAALAAALLHDVGHGPFSHTLESLLVTDAPHETISRHLIVQMAKRFDILELALQMFDDTYPRHFFHQLISSQLDMDRLDYLRRDTYYTGVVEGEVGVQRIIRSLRVWPPDDDEAEVVVEAKGVYAVENFLIARRLMYWQVYLHKTVIAGDQLLRTILKRVRHLVQSGRDNTVTQGAPSLLYFLTRHLTVADLDNPAVLARYCEVDDSDMFYSIKQWIKCSDPILADLSDRFINRIFPRAVFLENDPSAETADRWKSAVAEWLTRTGKSTSAEVEFDVSFYLTVDRSLHSAYETAADSIRVIDRYENVHELSEATDAAAVTALSRFEVKSYVCHPKEVALEI